MKGKEHLSLYGHTRYRFPFWDIKRMHLILFGRWKPVQFSFLVRKLIRKLNEKGEGGVELEWSYAVDIYTSFIFYITFVQHIRWSYAVDWYSGSWFGWASSVERLFFRGSHVLLFYRWKPIQFCCLVRKLIRKLNEKGRYKVQLVWSYAVNICTSILNPLL